MSFTANVAQTAHSVMKLVNVDVSNKETCCTHTKKWTLVMVHQGFVNDIVELDKMSFRMQCIDFLRAAVEKIIARSPLQYSLVRAIACFVPSTVDNSPVTENRIKLLPPLCMTEVT